MVAVDISDEQPEFLFHGVLAETHHSIGIGWFDMKLLLVSGVRMAKRNL